MTEGPSANHSYAAAVQMVCVANALSRSIPLRCRPFQGYVTPVPPGAMVHGWDPKLPPAPAPGGHGLRGLAVEPKPSRLVELAGPFVSEHTNWLVLLSVGKIADFIERGARGLFHDVVPESADGVGFLYDF